MSDTFKKFTFVFCQSTIQKERFINLGVKNQNIKVTGSVKFDLHDSLKENLKESSLKKYIIALTLFLEHGTVRYNQKRKAIYYESNGKNRTQKKD